jgi:nitroreductase
VAVLDVVAERWSTRVFDAGETLKEEALEACLEAARWAPSANNTQPCRFVVARRGSTSFAAVCASLAGFNSSWASAAGALLVAVTESVTAEGTPLRWAEYDAGQAAAYFTLQAHAVGLVTHQMGGFDPVALSAAFELDSRFVPLTVIAVGSLGDITNATPELRSRETAPRVRRPAVESLIVND